MHDFRNCVLLILGGFAVVLFAGCGHKPAGPAREEVTGRVLVDNKPLAAGRIRLTPTKETKGPAASAAVSDGYFQIPQEHGVPAGTYIVQVEDVGAADLNDEENFAKFRQQKVAAPRLPAHSEIAVVKSGEPNLLNLYVDSPASRPSSVSQSK